MLRKLYTFGPTRLVEKLRVLIKKKKREMRLAFLDGPAP